jgi:hypothetical protein
LSHGYDILIYLLQKPLDSVSNLKNVRFSIMNVEGEYMDDGVIVKAGDQSIVYKCYYDNTCTTDYSFPLYGARYFFGPKKVYVNKLDSGYGSYEYINLSELGENEEVTVNNSYLEPQGNMWLNSITYAHMARETSPFKDIILDTGSTLLYQKDAIWTENSVTFKFTNDHYIWHGTTNYLELKVLQPNEAITGVWFNLTGLELKEGNGNVVKAYSSATPLLELSTDNPISGTLFDFE